MQERKTKQLLPPDACSDKSESFTFIDLFCGIGGMRLGFESANFKCVFSSEINPYACHTYQKNFGELPHGDIRWIPSSRIPNFDLMVGGFPCQPYSIAGDRRGFSDVRGGCLFRSIQRILKEKQPKAFVLENVRGLISQDDGKTLEAIIKSLESLHYSVKWKLLNSKNFGVPQSRERIFIVGIRNDITCDFRFPTGTNNLVPIDNILEPSVHPKHIISKKVAEKLNTMPKRYKMVGKCGITRTITTSQSSLMKILVPLSETDLSKIHQFPEKSGIRKLTVREACRLQGFPDSFQIPVSDSQAYRQFGNAVTVQVAEAIAKELIKFLVESEKNRSDSVQIEKLVA